MQTRWIGYRVKGFIAIADRALYWDMICKTADERYKILLFWQRHGLGATQEAYGVARRTLYAWRAQLAASGGKPHGLTPRSTRPKQVRQRQWPASLVAEIRRLRDLHPNLGKEKLAPFIARFCQTHQLAAPSARTRRRRAARRGTARKGGSAAAPDHAFGGRARPAQGRRVIPIRRTDAAIHYIAEILGQFDLIAIVELRDNLEDLGRALVATLPAQLLRGLDPVPRLGRPSGRAARSGCSASCALSRGWSGASARPPGLVSVQRSCRARAAGGGSPRCPGSRSSRSRRCGTQSPSGSARAPGLVATPFRRC